MANDKKSDLDAALHWYRSNHAAVDEYCGEWVAIASSGVLAHGDELSGVIDEYKKQGFPNPLLYKVPPKGILALWWLSDA